MMASATDSTLDLGGQGLVDCHCHLSAAVFDQDIEEVVERAKKAGVQAVLVVAIDYTEFEKIIQLSKRFPDFVLPCLGVHPVQGALSDNQRSVTLEDLDKALPLIEKHIDHVAAIGEIGLDFQPRIVKTPEDKEIQRKVLRTQVELAKKHNLPVNVHSRSAGRPTIAALKECGADKVLLHAFNGKPSVAMTGVEAGYFFSIPPSIVRNDMAKLVDRLPVTNILIESDSPALGPDKDKRNEPANICISADFIAKAKKLDLSEMCKISTQNAVKLFPKLSKIIK